MTTTTMRRSWLVQRLTKPRAQGFLGGKDNPFAFGGGLRNGSLSDDAMDLLRPIFGFDYMGAAEFEFGAVPKALQALAKDKLAAFSVDVALADVPLGWRAPKDAPTPEGSATIYGIARKSEVDEVKARVVGWAAEDLNRLKEQTRLNSALRPVEEWDGDVQGWLELDNGFFFFADRVMWEQTCAVFGVKAVA